MAATFSPQRLRALREHRRLSREGLARLIGRSAASIEKYERAEITPSAESLGVLASALEVGVSDLFDEDPGDPRDRYIRAVCDLLPPLSDLEIEAFAAVVRARRTTTASNKRTLATPA